MTKASTSTFLTKHSDDSTEQAAYWFAVMLDPSVTTELKQEFQRWHSIAGHAAAYAEFSQLWEDSALALEPKPIADIAPSLGIKRHWYQQPRWYISGMAASVCLVVAIWLMPPKADYYTVAGQVKTVTLSDGSIARLSPDTQIKLRFTEQARTVELLQGEAWFQVSPDKTRPFTVNADTGNSTALGTAFAVSKQSTKTEVIITEHTVAVKAAAQEQILEAGQGVWYTSEQLSKPYTVDEQIRLAWLHHQLVFLAKPLGEVVTELNRWHSSKLILLGDELKNKQVTLILDTRQGDAMLQNLIQGLSLQSFSVGNQLTVLY